MALPVYADYAATSPLRPGVAAIMTRYLGEEFGNASSSHRWGQAARRAVDTARDAVAAALGCGAREVIFTSGATEANNLALRGLMSRRAAEHGNHLVVTAVEHESVLETGLELQRSGAFELSVIGCDRDGLIAPAAVAAAITASTSMVSVMAVNNETGVIQDLAGIALAVRNRNPDVLIHSDAVQALGRLRLDVGAAGIDALSVSAHKIGGPKGCGALYVSWGNWLTAQLSGGGQERGRRSGTENVAAIAGFGAALAAADAALEEERLRLTLLQRGLEERVMSALPEVQVAGAAAPRVPNITTFVIPGLATEPLLAGLDAAGVAVSGGSACSSGAISPAHTLSAMGYPINECAFIRCSLGHASTTAETERLGDAVISVVEQARSAAVLG